MCKKRYESRLEEAKSLGIKKGIVTGAMTGILMLVIFCAYALGFWYGWTLSQSASYSVGKVLLVFFSIIIGVFSLGDFFLVESIFLF